MLPGMNGAGGAAPNRGSKRLAFLAAGVAATWISGAAIAETTLPAAASPPGAAQATKEERLSPTAAPLARDPAAENAVMLRMQAAAETAVPIQDLDDALVVTGSVAPDGNGAQPTPPASGDVEALAYAPTAARNVDVLQTAAVPVAPAGPETAATPPAEAGRILANVKMRAKPDNAAEIVSVLAENAAVAVIACDYWCEVEAGGKRGFVFKKFVERKDASGERAAEKQEP